MNTLNAYKKEIHELCFTHKVKSLYAFGSVLTPDFNSNSDIDLIVDFKDLEIANYAENYFDLKTSLQNTFKRSVDLLEFHSLKNPYFKQALDKTKVLVYEE